MIEPYLIQQGYLQRTPRGRMATQAAYRHLGWRAPQNGNLTCSAPERVAHDGAGAATAGSRW